MDLSPFIRELSEFLWTHPQLPAQAILLRGSRTSPGLTDFWSDTDLVVIWDENTSHNSESLLSILHSHATIVGSELHQNEQSILFRLIFAPSQGIEPVDLACYTLAFWEKRKLYSDESLKILFGEAEIPDKISRPVIKDFLYSQQSISETWFKYFLCVKKFMRRDHLIGMHLLMDLIREALVVKMVKRDIRLQSNIHKFGQSEELTEFPDFSKLNQTHPESILSYILELGVWYDQELSRHIMGYKSRLVMLENYIQASLNQMGSSQK